MSVGSVGVGRKDFYSFFFGQKKKDLISELSFFFLFGSFSYLHFK